MDAFRNVVPVSLLARDATVSRENMRERLGITSKETVVFFNPRCPPDQVYPELVSRAEKEHVTVIVPSGYPAGHAGIIPIPPDETESQNWIGMCDCVVTRCGYSTVSEAVQARIPLMVWERPGFIEDRSIASAIRHSGIGTSLEYRQIRSFDWIAELDRIPRYKQHYERIDPKYVNNGSNDILAHLQEYLA
jgi:UDP-N-acetylglucosamine:LPS N-acetylglucosamine transferase